MPKLVNSGENKFLNILFGSTVVDATLYLGLYTAPTSEPEETAVLGDLTEPSGGGYARKSLTRGSWSVAGNQAQYAEQTFTAVGAAWGNVYGYFITDGINLLLVEQFDAAPFNVTEGSSVKITPVITCN